MYDMRRRRAALRNHVLERDESKLDAHLLSSSAEWEVEAHNKRLGDPDEMNENVQRLDASIRRDEAYCNIVLYEYATFADRLYPDDLIK